MVEFWHFLTHTVSTFFSLVKNSLILDKPFGLPVISSIAMTD